MHLPCIWQWFTCFPVITFRPHNSPTNFHLVDKDAKTMALLKRHFKHFESADESWEPLPKLGLPFSLDKGKVAEHPFSLFTVEESAS